MQENGEEPRKQSTSQSTQKQTDPKQQSSQADHSFDFDEFLKGGNIPELLTVRTHHLEQHLLEVNKGTYGISWVLN